MEQADVLKALGDLGIAQLKALLVEVAKEGGLLEMEMDILAAKGGVVAESIEAVAKPVIREALAALIAKI